jgi:hypothetical protein
MIKIENEYRTQSLALASALHTVSTAKLQYIEISPSNKRATFVFDRTKDTSFDDIVARFWARELSVDVSTYFEVLKQVKARLFEEIGR